MNYFMHKYSLPKSGYRKADYEDACAVATVERNGMTYLYAAVSDGAAESSFAGQWAKMLSRAYAKGLILDPNDLEDQVIRLAQRWEQCAGRRRMPWFAEEKKRKGAFASLCGVRFCPNPRPSDRSGIWSALAVGDSCLFQVRKDELITAFPLSRADAFGAAPVLISSLPADNSLAWEHLKTMTGNWEKGDLFIAGTDALARWFLVQHEKNERPWQCLSELQTLEDPEIAFRRWADMYRQSMQMKNDDITLILIEIGA